MKILKEGLAFSIAEIFGVKNIELKDSLRVQSILQEYADKQLKEWKRRKKNA